MLKMNAGFSRKIGEPNYGSRGASVNLELELESVLIGEPSELAARIRGLFALAREAVEEELTRMHQPSTEDGRPARSTPSLSQNGSQSPTVHQRSGSSRAATSSQLRAIRSICDRQGIAADLIAQQRHGINRIEELSLPEASDLIDELKSASPNGRRTTR